MARILIVDDEAALSRVMARYFRRRGHDVTEIGDYSAVRDEFDSRNYDVVFLDVCMPGMSGGEVCAALRIVPGPDGFDLASPPPIVLMTGAVELLTEDFVGRLGSGIHGCMRKPFSLAEAERVMEDCLEDSRCGAGHVGTPGLGDLLLAPA